MTNTVVLRDAETVDGVDTQNSLEVTYRGEIVYTSRGRWLHPLLDLERYLEAGELPRAELTLRDKVIGRAAAGLVIRLGLGRVHAVLLSRLGADLLTQHGVPTTYDTLVDQIACRTEDLTREMDDPEDIHRLVLSLVSS